MQIDILLKYFDLYNILWYYVNMEYNLIKSKRKTISIQILNNGEILVKAPVGTSNKFINDFIVKKQNWIVSHQQKVLEEQAKNNDYILLNKIIIFGESYYINKQDGFYTFGNYIVKTKNGLNKKTIIKNHIKNLAKDYLINRCNFIANKLNLKYNDLKIISAKRKWGSCNNKKQIKLNYKLVMLPKSLIDYVICHELCHLVEFNHSKNFWALMQEIGYCKRDIKKQFNEFGFILNMFS